MLSKKPVLHEHYDEAGDDILFELVGHVKHVVALV